MPMTNRPNGTIARVSKLPTCNVHGDHPAAYDCSIIYNGRRVWAFICEDLFRDPALGAGLGIGRGQKLEVEE